VIPPDLEPSTLFQAMTKKTTAVAMATPNRLAVPDDKEHYGLGYQNTVVSGETKR
jgi:hypothetical protein